MKVWDRKTRFKYAHLKRDGWQLRITGMRNGMLIAMTRSGIISLPEQFVEQYKWMCEANHYVDGELFCPDAPASQVASYLKHHPSLLHFEVYSASWVARGCSLHTVAAECEALQIPFIPFLRLQDEPEQRFDGSLHSVAADMGYCSHEDLVNFTGSASLRQNWNHEGWVLKDCNAGPTAKHKVFKSADLKITGVTWGEGRLEGTIGALICSDREGNEVANVFGMSDEVRAQMLAMWNSGALLGKIVEAQYQLQDSGGRLRHPTFIRFREDLNWE